MVAPWKRLGKELQAVGVQVTDVWQLVKARSPYPEAIPVLIRWAGELPDMDLPADERDQLLEGIVRALSVAEARPAAASTLLDIFPRMSGPVQWVVGNAIEITASTDHADRVIDIVQDASHGSSRQMLVLLLRRIAKNNPRTVETLERLINDNSVAPQAMTVMASLRPDLALRLAGQKVDSADPVISAAAKKAVKSAATKLEKA